MSYVYMKKCLLISKSGVTIKIRKAYILSVYLFNSTSLLRIHLFKCVLEQSNFLCFLKFLFNSIFNMLFSILVPCTVGQKKRNTPVNSNTNYLREMKLIPINMNYYLLQFDAIKFLLDFRLYGGGSLPNFNLNRI